MNKHLWFITAAVLSFAIYGCQQRTAERPSSETAEPPVLTNEISITQDTLNAVPPTIQLGVESTGAAVPGDLAQGLAAAPNTNVPTAQNIQQALTNAGIYEGKIDGDIGPRTKKAIRTFQAQNNLKVDGKVGPRTWERLSTYLNQAPTGTLTESAAVIPTQDFSD